MNDKIKVLIADDNYEFGMTLKNYLVNDEEMEIVGIARDGEEAYSGVLRLKPDVLLLDVIMPHLDGIGVLEKLNKTKLEKQPVKNALSALYNVELSLCKENEELLKDLSYEELIMLRRDRVKCGLFTCPFLLSTG